MNQKEISEIRRRIRHDRSNMTAIYGCYVNTQKEIISEFKLSTGTMPENEAEKYFGTMKRTLSGTIGKNLIDITFKTSQVLDSPEHKLLMNLLETELKDEQTRLMFYSKVIDSVSFSDNYLILLGCESYDVPFKKTEDIATAEDNCVYKYVLCAVCPVKLSNTTLNYHAEEKVFHDGGVKQIVCAPEIGFLFPAFDNRSANIYNALYYTRSPKENHENFVDAIFHTMIPKPAEEQKKTFASLLAHSLEDACSFDVVQTVHEQICQTIDLHKESRTPEPLLVSKEQIKEALAQCGVPEKNVAKFGVDYDTAFGADAELHAKNIINNKRFEINTPDISIKVNPECSDLIETRIIGGVKYLLICADENVEVNGVPIVFDSPVVDT